MLPLQGQELLKAAEGMSVCVMLHYGGSWPETANQLAGPPLNTHQRLITQLEMMLVTA